ncbi:hypothetical protein Ocin01_18370 [Orchesella cincta]|uniref:Uncharacterized protein n=1 Tax=Orchesella cincta TaxID=48709 RepID=A0A1D2M5W7_ORCCI|nr:hypothetical protein Ocin01_18370 [Orchesella cincta]
MNGVLKITRQIENSTSIYSEMTKREGIVAATGSKKETNGRKGMLSHDDKHNVLNVDDNAD